MLALTNTTAMTQEKFHLAFRRNKTTWWDYFSQGRPRNHHPSNNINIHIVTPLQIYLPQSSTVLHHFFHPFFCHIQAACQIQIQ